MPQGDTFLAIGVFDGVHRGHLHLLRRLRAEAQSLGAGSCVVTFANHPGNVLRPGSSVKLITTLEQRRDLFREAGIDQVVALTFDQALSHLRASEFVDGLVKYLHMRGMVVGPNFALGHRREGTVERLRDLGRERGFVVRQVEPLVKDESQIISSSAIRDSIAGGDAGRASAMLGRPFSLSGRVVKGAARGKALGFPTANLDVPEAMAVPGDGIYATWAVVGGRRYSSATSIGVRPTFGLNSRTVEAYLMDFQGDLYGKELTLEFVRRLRDELKFDTVEDLEGQMAKDVWEARKVLESQSNNHQNQEDDTEESTPW